MISQDNMSDDKSEKQKENTSSLIKKYREILSEGCRHDEFPIPDNPPLHSPYYFINISLNDLKQKDAENWVQKSGKSVKYFTEEGNIVHQDKNDKEIFHLKRLNKRVLKDDLFTVTFLYHIKEKILENGNQMWRRFAEIRKCNAEQFSLVALEFYEKTPDELTKKKRRRKHNKSALPQQAENIETTRPVIVQIPTFPNQIVHLQDDTIPSEENSVLIHPDPSGDDPVSKLISEIPDEFIQELNDISVDDLSGILPDVRGSAITIDSSTSCERDLKKTCYSGDVANHLENEEKVYIDPFEIDLKNISQLIGLYINECSHLGPVQILSKEGSQFHIAKDFAEVKNSEWRRLVKQSHLTTMLWSCPYVVDCDSASCGNPPPFVMFSLENYWDSNRSKKALAQQFKIKMKLIDCDVNENVALPCKLHVEVKVRLSSDSEEYTSPVSGWIKCDELDKYSLELLMPIPHNPGDKFPGMWITVHY